jgi:uncharacterized membrane protein YgaE (UPF0421/DUF939 family)
MKNFIKNHSALFGVILGIIFSPLILWIIPDGKQLLIIAILVFIALILTITLRKK